MRGYSTSLGGAFIIRKMMEERGKKPEQTTVAIQGMGNAGSNMAKILNDWKFKVIALSDSTGGIYNKDGIDIDAAIKHKEATKRVSGLKGADDITNDQLLALDVDILIPSALNCAIGPHNIDRIKAKTIVEIANGPICELSEEEMMKRKITIVPDVLANAGGVIGSYFEWRNNKEMIEEDEDSLVEELKRIMLDSYEEVKGTAKEHDVSLRDGAYILAAKRILEAEKRREHI